MNHRSLAQLSYNFATVTGHQHITAKSLISRRHRRKFGLSKQPSQLPFYYRHSSMIISTSLAARNSGTQHYQITITSHHLSVSATIPASCTHTRLHIFIAAISIVIIGHIDYSSHQHVMAVISLSMISIRFTARATFPRYRLSDLPAGLPVDFTPILRFASVVTRQKRFG
jgi:hypothetical protein